MAVSIPQINTAPGADGFSVLFDRFNEMANAVSTVVVTTAASNTGANTTGNAYVNGILGAATLTGSTLRGGTPATPATLNVSSNVAFINNSSLVLGNTSINSTSVASDQATFTDVTVTSLELLSDFNLGDLSVAYIQKQTTGTTSQVVDSFLLTSFRSAEYQFSIKDNSANGFQTSKIQVMHDDTSAYITEYGVMISNTTLGIFSASTNSTALIISVEPTSANTTIKASRSALAV